MPLQLYRLTAICAIRTSPQNRYISCKWLKCTSCIMTTCTSRYSRIDRLNYDVTWTRLPVQLYWLMLLSLVLCEYSKFRIESNSYLLFDSIRKFETDANIRNFRILIWLWSARRLRRALFVLCQPWLLYSPVIEASAAPRQRVCVHPPLPLLWPPHGSCWRRQSRPWLIAL